ncbi:hypothetical protein [Ethanoligenens sp.]|uniref:hypothetical protein n=1 Tax=Ethanoligenens sp. TaxID=2099655 RepID=UPI0039E87348
MRFLIEAISNPFGLPNCLEIVSLMLICYAWTAIILSLVLYLLDVNTRLTGNTLLLWTATFTIIIVIATIWYIAIPLTLACILLVRRQYKIINIKTKERCLKGITSFKHLYKQTQEWEGKSDYEKERIKTEGLNTFRPFDPRLFSRVAVCLPIITIIIMLLLGFKYRLQ